MKLLSTILTAAVRAADVVAGTIVLTAAKVGDAATLAEQVGKTTREAITAEAVERAKEALADKSGVAKDATPKAKAPKATEAEAEAAANAPKGARKA